MNNSRKEAADNVSNEQNNGTTTTTSPRIEYGVDKLGIDRIGPFVRRQYESCGTFQWAREFIQNAIEAQASLIQFEPEWQAAAGQGILRWKIWDNGTGMSDSELKAYMNNLSAGSKTIDGKHDNFGIGLRISTLPWNPSGIVIVSVKDGFASMLVLKYDESEDTYGVEKFDGEAGIETVVEPGMYGGVDYNEVIPEKIIDEGHGTVFVLLGSPHAPHTIFGDPNRPEGGKQALQTYIRQRYFVTPQDFTIRVLRAERHGSPDDVSGWPVSPGAMNAGAGEGAAVAQWDEVSPLSRWLEESRKKNPSSGKIEPVLQDCGQVELVDATGSVPAVLYWYLAAFEPGRAPGDVATGHFSYLYRGELYGLTRSGTASVAAFRDFGVYPKSVRKRLWFVLEPQLSDLGDPGNPVWGVQPDDARSALEVVRESERMSVAELRAEWGRDFMSKMPEDISQAIEAESSGTMGLDLERMDKLKKRFGDRWTMARVRVSPKGSEPVEPDSDGNGPDGGDGTGPVPRRRARRRKVSRKGGSGSPGKQASGGADGSGSGSDTGDGSLTGRRTREAAGLPEVSWHPESEFEEVVPAGVNPGSVAGSVAARPGHDPRYPHGLIKLNHDYAVVTEVIQEWIDQFRDRDPEKVRQMVLNVYATVAVAKVAHSFALGTGMDEGMRDRMFSPEALTIALAGIYPEESAISREVRALPVERLVEAA